MRVRQVQNAVRSIPQKVAFPWRSPLFDRSYLPTDRNHRLAEPVDFRERFRFRRLDHQRTGHRKAHGRRMETVVDEPLGDVVDAHPGRRLERP